MHTDGASRLTDGQDKMGIDPKLEAITEKVLGAAFTVSNTLGHGFLEAVYKNALCRELEEQGICVQKEQSFPIGYKGKNVGVYIADVVVERCVIVELKAVENLIPAHSAQVINYLKASDLPVGLLLNFGKPRLQVKRLLLDHPRSSVRREAPSV